MLYIYKIYMLNIEILKLNRDLRLYVESIWNIVKDNFE